MQVRRGVFFARSLRERFEPGVKKKPRFAAFFFAGRTARSGYLPATPFATTISARVGKRAAGLSAGGKDVGAT